MNDPDIIMADELTGNLDSVNSELIFEIFSQQAKSGNTLVVITHDEDFAKRSDRVLKMIDGSII
jgi:lipoprotein-releasing system ATP-binding protein